MGKMVTSPMTIREGAVNVHPSLAILLRLTSGRPTSGSAAGAFSAAPEMVVISYAPCPVVCPRSATLMQSPEGWGARQIRAPQPRRTAVWLEPAASRAECGAGLRLGRRHRRRGRGRAGQGRVHVGVDRGAQRRVVGRARGARDQLGLADDGQ